MLSRVAENAYWLARYLERAEDTARLIGASSLLVLDLPKSVSPSWGSLVEILGASPGPEQGQASERDIMAYLILDSGHPGSIASCVRMARENARVTRDVLPSEMWEGINGLYLMLRERSAVHVERRRRLDLVREVIHYAQRIQGVQAATLSRERLFRFLTIGQSLERGDMTSRIVDVRAASLLPEGAGGLGPYANVGWMSLLRSLGAYEMYRYSRRPRIAGNDVVDFLFCDHRFPRSVYFCLREIDLQLRSLGRPAEAMGLLRRLRRWVFDAGPGNMPLAELHQFIDNLQVGLGETHDSLRQAYFA